MISKKALESFKKEVLSDSTIKETKKRKIKLTTDYINFLNNSNVKINKASILDIEKFIRTKSNLKASSLNIEIARLRMFYDFLQKRGLINQDIKRQIKFRRTPKKLPKNLSRSMMLKLCEPTTNESDMTKKAIRNQAILEFLFSTGVRNGELRTVKLKQLSTDLKSCLINTSKKGPSRLVFLGKYARVALYLYLQTRQIDIVTLKKCQKNMTVFAGPREKPLQSATVTNLIKKLAIKRIGCPVTPHMIRHTFATEMLKATGCLRSVQVLMGHAKISSTVRYCHLNTADKKKAIELFHPRSFVDNHPTLY